MPQLTNNEIAFVNEMLNINKPNHFIVEKLVEKGHDYNNANNYVNNMYEAKYQKEVGNIPKSNSNGALNIVVGVLLIIVGVGITLSKAGVIAYGAIIVGVIRLIKGISSTSN